MAHTASRSFLRSDFDRFLFEPIGKDRNGMPLSVASALARMDLDAWQEAATLAALPADAAVKKLTALFGASPDQGLMEPNQATLVTRLIALLPTRGKVSALSLPISAGSRTFTLSRAATRVIIFVVYLIALLSSQFVISHGDSGTLGGPSLERAPHSVAPEPSLTVPEK